MQRFNDYENGRPFYRPGFNRLSNPDHPQDNQRPVGRQSRFGPAGEPNPPYHPYRRHLRAHRPNVNPAPGLVHFRPGLMGEPYGVYHTDGPNFYQQRRPHNNFESRNYDYGIGDDAELN